MNKYRNLDGDSGVFEYRYDDNMIGVKFSDGVTYDYESKVVGARNFEEMKKLADNGRGLNSFINKTVKKKYSNKY